jgi:hypothetical protein
VPDDLVRVLAAATIPEGEIAKARLEDEGIPVLMKGGGEDPYRFGPAYLFVPREYEVQARLILTADLGLDADEAGSEDAREERPGPMG